jgi:ABC-type transporter Mla MlaB component
MAKEETAPGLLSKMVKFVRNPATSWSELDAKVTDRDEAVSKLLLKEMIERKRRNDFVRKREFDMLRKMRKREAMVGQDPGARPSFFQSSMPSKPDDRAKTLKKIDEIEAQMSMQWWKTKQGNASTLNSGDASSSNFPASVSHPGAVQQPAARQPVKAVPMLDNALPGLPAGYGVTEPIGLSGVNSVPPIANKPVPTKPVLTKPAPVMTLAPKPVPSGGLAGIRFEGGTSGFSHTNMMAMDVSEIAHDAELEEASIRFANGDDSGAETGLLEMLAPGGSRASQSETWMALFDFYRATDEQEKFENAAIKYVQKFDRSAPQWFSIPDMVKAMASPTVSLAGNGPAADWICPSSVGIQTVAALKAAMAKAPMPWRLDWSNLKTIEPLAVEPLSKVFAGWSAQPVQVRFIGDAQLQDVLQKGTPSGQRDTPQAWWQLRMEALRVTHRPDEFELAALDFCVTYEVSPPSWETARCDYKSLDSQGLAASGHTIIGEASRDSVPSALSLQDGDSHMDALTSQMSQLMSIELSGQIEGDAVAILEQLETKLLGADIMMISCAKLIRVDFSAAGTLLNWVSARQAENRSVQFSEVNRLVAAFFNVIGITEHAKVLARRD